jgi:hypothetical protein
MHLTAFTKSDIDDLPGLQPADWNDLRIFYRYYLRHPGFCVPKKITENKKLIAIGTIIFHSSVAWLAHIVVDENSRNHGVGKFLTEELLNIIPSSFKTISLLATPLGEPVYRKIGFKIQGDYNFYRIINKPEYPVSPSVIPFGKIHSEEIFALDAMASGENRSSRLMEFLDDAWIYSDRMVRGFFLPSFGEGLIISGDKEAGIELMKKRISINDTAVIPALNISATEFFVKNKFEEYRTAKRMWMGTEIHWQPEMIFNRVSGQVG